MKILPSLTSVTMSLSAVNVMEKNTKILYIRFRFSKLLRETFRRRPGKLTKGLLFYQDNTPAHKYVVAMAAVRDCGFEKVEHPPYSPDLASSIFRSPP